MPKFCLCLVLLWGALIAISYGKPLSQKKVDDLTTYLLDIQNKEDIPRMALALYDESGERFLAAASRQSEDTFDKNTPFPAPSLSEPLLSFLAARLEQAGTFTWQDPAYRICRDFKLNNSTTLKQIKLEHLLTQTAGFPNSADEMLDPSWSKAQDIYSILKQTYHSGNVGDDYAPSKLSQCAAALIIADAAGYKDPNSGYAQLAHDLAFTPMGLKNSQINTTSPLYPLDSLEMSIADLGAWMVAESTIMRGELDVLLKQEFAERRLTLKPKGSPEFSLSWIIRPYREKPIAARGGSIPGHTILVGFLPEDKIAFAAYASSDHPRVLRLFQEIPLALVDFTLSSK